jgi:hypothetical protein
MIHKTLSVLVACLFSLSAFATDPMPPSPSTPTPMPTASFSIDITGGSFFAGVGQGSFEGDSGQIDIDKIGGGETILNLYVVGDTCGFDCQDSSFDFTAKAFEAVQVLGTATGGTAGSPVILQNAGQTLVGTSLLFNRGPGPATEAPTND